MKIRFSNLIKGLREVGDDVTVVTPCINPPRTFHGAKARPCSDTCLPRQACWLRMRRILTLACPPLRYAWPAQLCLAAVDRKQRRLEQRFRSSQGAARGQVVNVLGFSLPFYNSPTLLLSLGLSARVLWRLLTHRPDVIHVSSPGFLVFAATLYAKLLSIPLARPCWLLGLSGGLQALCEILSCLIDLARMHPKAG